MIDKLLEIASGLLVILLLVFVVNEFIDYQQKQDPTESAYLSTETCYCTSLEGYYCYFELEAFHDLQIMHPRVLNIVSQKPANKPYHIFCGVKP